VADKPADNVVAAPDTAAPREPVKAAGGDTESESDVASAIHGALQVAASALSGRRRDAAAMLGGGIQDQWVALMNEGRIAVSVNGAPAIERSGSRATAEFDATVNVRSPFGANRRRPAKFSAELQRSGSGWRVVSLRPVGALELK
jgi:hypothetical protein